MKKKDKEEKIKELTWDYFWEAKSKEFMWAIIVVSVFTLVPYLLGKLAPVSWCMSVLAEEITTCGYMALWFIGLLILAALGFIGAILYLIIKFNWDSAKWKAEEDLE